MDPLRDGDYSRRYRLVLTDGAGQEVLCMVFQTLYDAEVASDGFMRIRSPKVFGVLIFDCDTGRLLRSNRRSI